MAARSRVLAAPDWDFGAKVPARTEAVNDGAGKRTIRPDLGRGCFVQIARTAPGLAAI